MKRLFSLLLCIGLAGIAQAQSQQLQKLSQVSFSTSCAGVWQYVDSVGNEYALLGNGDGLVIVDVTNPVSPQVLFTVPAVSSLWREVKTYSHYAYAGTEGGGGITIVDLSGLPNTYQSKIYDGDGVIAGQLSSSHTVQVFGDYLYIFGSNINTVICSLADPWNPQYVGTYSANYVHDGYVLNDTLYSSEIYDGQFSVVDVTNKANPVVVATQSTPGLFNHNCWFSDDHRYLYTTDEQPYTPVGVFDMADIQNIQLVETYFNDSLPNKEVHNVRVFNDYIIAPSYGSQLTIVDAARPENLIEIARYATGGYLCWDASPYLPSGNIVATDMDGEFYVFAPYYVRACYLEGNITDQTTGLPVNSASVHILSTTISDYSNNTGDYKTGNATAGTFDVEFSKAGYITQVISGVVLTNGVLTTLDVQLEPFSAFLNVIDNGSGLPIPFAKVKIQGSTTDMELIANAGGVVQLNAVSSGSYDITAGKWGYKSACISTIIGSVGSITIGLDAGIYDDFTFDFGWFGSGTATAGLWVRAEPIGTFFSTTPANPELDVINDCSDRCFMTGNGGGTGNNDDVDDGTAILTSPVFDLTAYTDPYLNFSSWFFEQFSANPAANDTMYVSLQNGIQTVPLAIITGAAPTNSSWVSQSIRILNFTTLTANMHVLVEVSDKLGTANPLECGFDRFEITEGPTSVTDIYAEELGIYPNPASDFVTLSLPASLAGSPVSVSVKDISGREIYSSAPDVGNQLQIDTRAWSHGVYFVSVITPAGKVLGAKLVR